MSSDVPVLVLLDSEWGVYGHKAFAWNKVKSLWIIC